MVVHRVRTTHRKRAERRAQHRAGVVSQRGGDVPLPRARAGAQLAARARQVSAQQLQAGIGRGCHHKHGQRRERWGVRPRN